MKNFLRYISAGVIVLLVSGFVIADTFKQGEAQLVTDGDMEAAGTASWIGYNNPTLSKESGAAEDGSQVLRIAYSGTSYPQVIQYVQTIGNQYRATGWCRGDGTYFFTVRDGGVNIFIGTSSTDWQYFDVTYTATANNFRLVSGVTAAGYSECDDVMVTEYIPPSKDAEAHVLADGDMETAGTGSWTGYNNPTLSKESGAAEDGSQILKVARNDTDNPSVYQGVLTSGKTYRVTGWTRSDGNATPRIYVGGLSLDWEGTTSTDWQYFDFEVAADAVNFLLMSLTSTGNQYIEWDDIFVTEYAPPTKNFYEQLLVDGDMEGADTSAWTALNNATLTKESGAVEDGSQVFRIAHNGTNYPQAAQYVQTIGNRYRATGWCRGDGTYIFTLRDGGVNIFIGGSSTDWQYFDVTYTASANNFRLVSGATAAGYSECDDVVVVELD